MVTLHTVRSVRVVERTTAPTAWRAPRGRVDNHTTAVLRTRCSLNDLMVWLRFLNRPTRRDGVSPIIADNRRPALVLAVQA